MPRLRLLPPATVVDTDQRAAEVLTYLMNRGGTLAIDTETTGLDKFRDRILYWSMATENARYFLEAKYMYAFQPLFANKKIRWRLANAKFDMHQFATAGVTLVGDVRDIIVQDAMLDDTRPHGLKEQSWREYEVRWGDFKDLFLSPERVAQHLSLDKKAFTAFKSLENHQKLEAVYAQAPNIVIDYASCDAYFTYMLGEDLDRQMGSVELPVEQVPGMHTLADYFDVIEVPLTKALWRMERKGVAVDRDYAKSVDVPMRKGLLQLEDDIAQVAGRKINPKATADVAALFFDQFKLKPVNFTNKGAPAVTEKDLKLILSKIQPDGRPAKAIRLVLEHKKLTKLHGTYVKNIDDVIGPDGRIHSTTNQTGARTSRLSSTEPNLQNIPIRNDPYQLRGMFVAGEGCMLVDRDYPQIEFRIAAVLAREESMMQAFHQGWDIHTANAAATFGLQYEDIVAARAKKDASKEAAKRGEVLKLTDAEKWACEARDRAKAIGLGTLYCRGSGAIAAELGIQREEAQRSIDKFFSANPGIQNLMHYMQDQAHDTGYTYTMLGRMRQLHRINCGMRGLEAAEERQAWNTLVQGSGAEMMKLAILRCDSDPRMQELGAGLVLTVHDELIAEAPDDTATDVGLVMDELMADPYRWGPIQLTYPVPIPPDGSEAKRWSQAK